MNDPSSVELRPVDSTIEPVSFEEDVDGVVAAAAAVGISVVTEMLLVSVLVVPAVDVSLRTVDGPQPPTRRRKDANGIAT